MRVDGSLLEAISRFHELQRGRLGVLVIDMEEQCMGGGVGDNIRHVYLRLLSALNCPFGLLKQWCQHLLHY